jgi:protein phosphatase
MRKSQMPFETGAATHVGKVRLRNEDSYFTRPESGIWAVADGMGGHEAGDLASQTVIEVLKSIQTPSSAGELLSFCKSRIFEANSRLKEMGQQRGGVIIGTTVTVLLTFDRYFACLWAGDSRMYIVRQGSISQVSRDHTEVQDLLTDGSITPGEAETWVSSNVITRAIGVIASPELEVATGVLHPGDVFVICTDGLTRHLEDDEIMRHTTAYVSQEACDRMIMLTLERGAVDNVTIIVVRYDPERALRSEADANPPTISE